MAEGIIIFSFFIFWMISYRQIVIDHMLFREEGIVEKIVGVCLWLYITFGAACFIYDVAA